MIPALISFAQILTTYLFCTNWAVGPPEWGGGSVCAHCSVSAPAQGGSSLNICLMSERKNKWHRPTLRSGGASSCSLYTDIRYLTTFLSHGRVRGNIFAPPDPIRLCSPRCWFEAWSLLPEFAYFRAGLSIRVWCASHLSKAYHVPGTSWV